MSKIVSTKRTSRFSNPEYKRVEFNSFSFGKSLKSYKSDDLCFTNWVKSKENQCYILLENYVISTLDDSYLFLIEDFYPLDEIKYTYNTADRILNIINKGYGHKYKKNDLTKMYKIKSKINSKFQFYIYESRSNLTVLLIDFFHLVIPTDIYKANGDIIKTELSKLYNKQAQNKWNINNILK